MIEYLASRIEEQVSYWRFSWSLLNQMPKDIRALTTPAKIGKYYLVPHLKVKEGHGLAYCGKWMPVIGDVHDDPEIAKAAQQDIPSHYHFDWRFIEKSMLKAIEKTISGRYLGAGLDAKHVESTQIKLMKRKCLREIVFPVNLCKVLEPIYVGKKTGCSICPHRGIPLNGLTPDDDGNVICPAHGLKVNQKTGLVVNRSKVRLEALVRPLKIRVEKVGNSYKIFSASGVYPETGIHFSKLISAAKEQGHEINTSEDNYHLGNANEFFSDLAPLEVVGALIVDCG